jgi:hypothetical protein
MKRKFSAVLAGSIGAFLFGAVLFVHAQDSAPPPPPEAEFLGIEMGAGPHHIVKNAPYSAQTKIEITQTLADGTHIDSTSTGASYRDSQGRTRREQTLNGIGPLPMAHGKSGQFIMIHDPVAGTHYMLDPATKTATTGGPHGGPRGDKGGPEAWHERGEKADSANVTTESLGTQTIDGVSATGTRTTRTIPAGQIGNDKPIQIVTEKWVSPDLQVVVMSKHSDPRLGTFTYQLTNITRSEPASTLFQVPADYTVKQGNFRHGGPPPAAAPPQE